jgi:hypothetical protein
MTYQQTSYVPCERYFEQLPKTTEQVIDVIAEDANEEMLVITASESEKVKVFTSEKDLIKVKDEESYINRFKPSNKRAKRVNFSDFKRTDPVLSQFPNEALEEFEVPERKYVQDILAEIIDVMIE